MIKIPASLLREIYDHTEASYPYECCGLLVGTTDPDQTHVVHTFRKCRNLNEERARDRYLLDPKDWLRVNREFDGGPLEVIGIYHSHPDHPSRPSVTDRDGAYEGYSYVIISVQKGTVASANSWLLKVVSDTEREFNEEPLVTEGDSK